MYMPPFQAVRPSTSCLRLRSSTASGPTSSSSRYGFDHAGEFELVHNSSSYDSLAVLGVAHLRATGELAPSEDLSGGPPSAAEVLRQLGFTVDGRRSATTRRNAPVDAADVGDEASRARLGRGRTRGADRDGSQATTP